ncbi:LysR family transcriptional regulator [Bdellovibrio sp. HCB-162]|uniref:LysR family transcriptional regulator n=1 Tax=Bdellovibrio sp. HCB-162 TaxID=3394234 RepID=UPI0039BC5111
MNKKRLAEHLEKLSTFKVVADLKSVHKASSQLGLTQPAVSRTIKVLEDVLECQLMERESRGIRLTPEGQRLYGYAKIIAKTLENFDATGDNTQTESGPLRVATYDNIACRIISGLGKKLISELPHLSISVGGPNSRVLGDLVGGKFDCAFIAQPRVVSGLEYKKLFTERYGLFVSSDFYKKNKLNGKKNLRIDDLKSFQVIAMPDAIAGTNKNIDRLLWEIGLKNPLSVDSYEVAMRLTEEGLGIGIMPLSTAWRSLRENRLRELHLKDVPKSSLGLHHLTLCWNPKQMHPGITVFEKILTDFFLEVKS